MSHNDSTRTRTNYADPSIDRIVRFYESAYTRNEQKVFELVDGILYRKIGTIRLFVVQNQCVRESWLRPTIWAVFLASIELLMRSNKDIGFRQ